MIGLGWLTWRCDWCGEGIDLVVSDYSLKSGKLLATLAAQPIEDHIVKHLEKVDAHLHAPSHQH